MSKKVAKNDQASQNDGKIVVRLRLTPSEIEDLKAAGGKNGRKLATEIAYRLRGGETSPPPSPFANWPAADAADFEAVGDAVAQLFAEVTLMTGTKTALKQRLGYLKPSVLALLDELGADEAKPDDAKFFAGITRGLVSNSGALAAIAEIVRQRINVENEAMAEFNRRQEAQENDAKTHLGIKDASREKKRK